RTAALAGTDVGRSSADVQRLSRRLRRSQEEADNRRPLVAALLDAGKALLAQTEESFDSAGEKAATAATGDLDDDEEEVDEESARMWREFRASDTRRCTERLRTALAALDRALERRRAERVKELAATAKLLDHDMVDERQAETKRLSDSLISRLKQLKRRLEETLTFFEFSEQVEELQAWLRRQEAALRSIEPGTDEESCERSADRCAGIRAALRQRQPQLDQLDARLQSLQAEKNCRLESARTMRDRLQTQLAGVHLAAKDLAKTLHDSRRIHRLLYEAASLHEALQEKLREVESLASYGAGPVPTEELLRRLAMLTDSEFKPLAARRDDLGRRSRLLTEEFKGTDAEQVIRDDVSAVERLWQELSQAAEAKRRDLLQAKEAHASLAKFADLLPALQALLADILAEELARDFKSALEQVDRSSQRAKDVKRRDLQAQDFARSVARWSRECPASLAEHLAERVQAVNRQLELVQSTHRRRHEIYLENADIRKVLERCDGLDRWLDEFGREFEQCAPAFDGPAAEQLEARGRRSDELTALLLAQAPRVEALRELTLLERRFQEQQRAEAEQNKGAAASAKRTMSAAHSELTAGLLRRQTMKAKEQSGGVKNPARKWKKRYAALCGHLLALFKDKTAYNTGDRALHSLVIYAAQCETDSEHRNSLRLQLKDGSLYLLMLPSNQDCLAWRGQIKFRAGLDPSRQLVEEELQAPVEEPAAAPAVPAAMATEEAENDETEVTESLSSEIDSQPVAELTEDDAVPRGTAATVGKKIEEKKSSGKAEAAATRGPSSSATLSAAAMSSAAGKDKKKSSTSSGSSLFRIIPIPASPMSGVGLELGEQVDEEGGVGVQTQHVPAAVADHAEAAVPEGGPIVLKQEGFERVADLVAHIGVGHVQAGEHRRLQLALRCQALANRGFQQHEQEYEIRRVDECGVRPALQDQAAVNRTDPGGSRRRVGRRIRAASVKKSARALQQLGRAGLDNQAPIVGVVVFVGGDTVRRPKVLAEAGGAGTPVEGTRRLQGVAGGRLLQRVRGGRLSGGPRQLAVVVEAIA
uniref:PH domain-containing protein n=1 Tax=Macrostomum lignano TaxID=282301 RepID=A0A1I8IJN6_9PLAT